MQTIVLVSAREIIAGPISADIVKVRDGDSIDVVAHVWPGNDIRVSVRIRGIDAPELRGKCPAEIQLARKSRDALTSLLGNKKIQLARVSGGKYYGRVLAEVFTMTGQNVGSEMLRGGHARPYRGRKRQRWCEETASIGQ